MLPIYDQALIDGLDSKICWYLSGPMTGLPEHNFPAFNEAAMVLRAHGLKVWNPADNPDESHLTWNDYIRMDLSALVQNCQGVVVLPNWRQSKGARLEVHVATEIGMPVLDYRTMHPARETICEEANRLVYGDRGNTYAHPFDDYVCTAQIWSAILGHEVTAEQAVLCMIGVKLSRVSRKFEHRDSLVDIAGYAECAQRVVDRRAGRE